MKINLSKKFYYLYIKKFILDEVIAMITCKSGTAKPSLDHVKFSESSFSCEGTPVKTAAIVNDPIAEEIELFSFKIHPMEILKIDFNLHSPINLTTDKPIKEIVALLTINKIPLQDSLI